MRSIKKTSYLIDDYIKSIKTIIDASAGNLSIDSLEIYYTSYEYDTIDGIFKLDEYLKPLESPIYLDLIDILKLQNLKYSITGNLSGIDILENTHYWNQIVIHLCYEILRMYPLLYTDDQKNIYNQLKNRLSKISDFIDEIKYLFKKNLINITNYVYLLFMKYYEMEIKTNKNINSPNEEEYVHRVVTDIELYDHQLYTSFNLTNKETRDIFINNVRLLFKEITPYLSFQLDKNKLIEISNELLGYTVDFKSYDEYINFTPPYHTILTNLMNLNIQHLSKLNTPLPMNIRQNIYSVQDIFLDVHSWKEINNFSVEIYLDHLFLNFVLSMIHKYILAMKGILYFQMRDEIIKYINKNKSYLNGTLYTIKDTKKYKENVEIKTIWNNTILLSLLSQSENITLYEIVRSQSQNLYQFVDFIIYYIILINQTPTYKTILGKIQNYTSYSSEQITNLENIVRDLLLYVPDYKNIRDQSMIKNNISPKFHNTLNNVYSLTKDNFVLFNGNLFTPSGSFHNMIFDNVFRKNEKGLTGEINKGLGITGGTEDVSSNVVTNNSRDILQLMMNESSVFYSLNFDKEAFDHSLLTSDLSLTSKLIYTTYTKPKNISDLTNTFGVYIADYIVYRKINDNIFQDIYHLRDKVTPFALMYFLVEYSLGLSLNSKPYGKAYNFDVVSNINLDYDDYLDKFKNKMISIQSGFDSYMTRNRNVISEIVTKSIYDRPFLDYFNTPKVYEFYDLYTKNIDRNIQRITLSNYSYFIEQFIEKKINNPYEILRFISQFEYDENIIDVIRETIKKNYSQYLSKYFYYDWVYSYRDSEGNFDTIVFYTLSKLMEYGFMSEDEYFSLMSMNVEDTEMLYIMMKIYYSFTKDPNDYYKNNGDNDQEIPQLNTSSKVENIIDIIKSMNVDNMRIPTQEMMRKLIDKTPDIDVTRTEEEIQKELNSLVKEDLKNTIDNTDEENEQLEKKFIESGDVQSMHEYMKKQHEKRGLSLSRWLDEYMYGMMTLQIILSMFDPTQVLVDYTFERLLNQGVLGDFIDEWKRNNKDNKEYSGLVMDLSMYPSSLTALHMYEQMVHVLKNNRKVVINRENMLNLLDTWTEDEKWEIEKHGFLASKSFLSMIHNNNPIRYSGSPKIGIQSQIQKIEYTVGKMVVQQGGSGLMELRSI
jgi:histone H3/H4